MRFKKTVVGIGVEVDGNGYFNGSLELFFQIPDKVRYPAIEIIVVTVAYEYIVLITGDNACH
jgi:hypothetical protein